MRKTKQKTAAAGMGTVIPTGVFLVDKPCFDKILGGAAVIKVNVDELLPVGKLVIFAQRKPPARCICQVKVDTKKHHSFRSPVRSYTELGFYSPERPQVAHNYNNEHTHQEALEHP